MTKKLNINQITSELKDSPYFSREESPEEGSPTPQRPTERTPERANADSPRKAPRRFITRGSFEFYQDQLEALRQRSLELKLAGFEVSMSEMVREAVDAYFWKLDGYDPEDEEE